MGSCRNACKFINPEQQTHQSREGTVNVEKNGPRVLPREGEQLYDEAAGRIHERLAAAGIVISNLFATQVTPHNSDRFVPVLLEALDTVKYQPVAARVADLLAEKFLAGEALDPLVSRFRGPLEGYYFASTARPGDDPNAAMRDALGWSVSRFASSRSAELMLDLASDASLGGSRFAIIDQLPKTKDPSVPEVLRGLVSDPTVAAFAIERLGKMRYSAAHDVIESSLDSQDENVRTAAARALRRIAPMA